MPDSKKRVSDEAATSTLEFAVVAPTFLFFLFAMLGVGLEGLYQLALDDAVRYAARQIQIGGAAATSATGFVSSVCGQFSYLASDCTKNLTYNVQASTPASGFSRLTPATLPASGQLGGGFFNGTGYAGNVNVLVQIAYPLPFPLPFLAKLLTGTGTSSMLATTAVRAEPS